MALALAAAGAPAAPSAPPRFRADDPLRVDPDRLPVPRPAEVELSTAYDVLEHTFRHRPDGAVPPAVNANTVGEVPDSSWFTNRIGVRALSLAELARGPNRGDGPDTSRRIDVIAAKAGGITPGFTLRDARGDVYFVKLDPAAHPGLSTAADVIGARFLHAAGYHVPENHIAYLRRDLLRVAPEARVRERGKRRPLTEADLEANLRGAARLPDGRFRVIASRRLDGQPIGPFLYHGTRGDDPNDVFPHEHRRELRGLRVFAAWLNHDDSRSLNTLDTWIPLEGDGAGEAGRLGHVRHHLIDFSSTLGAGSNARREIAPQNPRAGNEYVLELGPGLRALFSLGLLERPWRGVTFPVLPGVGNIEADFFRPEAWRPEYPNPAFERLRPADAFWAAAILARFTDDAIRAVVSTGELEPRSSAYLSDVLIRRRDKSLAHWLAQLNPLDGFVLEGGVLRFRNVGEEAGLGPADGYEASWSAWDEATGARTDVGEPLRTAAHELPVPASGAEVLVARIRTRSLRQRNWARAVDVFLRGGRVVGVEREE